MAKRMAAPPMAMPIMAPIGSPDFPLDGDEIRVLAAVGETVTVLLDIETIT